MLHKFDPWCFNWDTTSDEDQPTDPYGMALMLTSIEPGQPFKFDYNEESPPVMHSTAPGDVVLSTPNSDWLGHHIFRPIADVELTAQMDAVQVVSETARSG